MKVKILSCLFIIGLFANFGIAQPGTLDTSFGENGIVHRSFEYPSSKTYSGQAILETPDGKILTAGISGGDNGLVARFNTDGSTDTLSPAYYWFSYEGGVLIFGGATYQGDDPIVDAAFYDIAIQPDGKMVSVGTVLSSGPSNRYFVLRQEADGSHDLSFGEHGNGFSIGGNPDGSGHSVAIQTDGKILVGTPGRVIRYLSNGHIDTSFATNGVFFSSIGGGDHMTLLPNGKIMVAGFSMGAFALARINSDGTLDNGFGTNGVSLSDIINSLALVTSFELLPNGDMLAIGRSGTRLAVAKFDNNGQLVMDYGTDGVALVELTGKYLVGTSSTIQSDGKLVVAGYVGTSGQDIDDFLLARFTTEGELDDSFGDGGLLITDFSTKSDRLNGVAMQEDGKIIVTGYAGKDYGTNGWGTEFIVARYHSGLEVGANEPPNIINNISIYPNPTTDYLNFYVSAPISLKGAAIRIIDAAGSVIKEFKVDSFDSTFIVPVWDWAIGTYWVQVTKEGNVLDSKSFVKINN